MRHIACGPHPGGPPGCPLAVVAKRQDATSKKPPFQGAQSTLSGGQDDECCEQERCGCPKSAKAKHQAALKCAQLSPCDQILCHDLLRCPCHDLCLPAREACLFKPLGMFLCVEIIIGLPVLPFVSSVPFGILQPVGQGELVVLKTS